MYSGYVTSPNLGLMPLTPIEMLSQLAIFQQVVNISHRGSHLYELDLA